MARADRGPARDRAPPSTGRCGSSARAAGSTQAVGRGGSHNPSPRAVSAAHPPARRAAPRQWEGVRAARGRRREKKNAARPHPRGPAHAAVAATGQRSGPRGATGTTHPLAPRNKVRCRSRPHAPPWTGKHREKRRERYKQPLRDGTETRCPLQQTTPRSYNAGKAAWTRTLQRKTHWRTVQMGTIQGAVGVDRGGGGKHKKLAR